MKKYLIIIITLLTIFIISCKETKNIDIYTTVYPIEFITKQIVGDKLTVESVYPRGKSIHDYEPQPKKIISIAKSNCLFYIGLGLEPFIENGLDSTFKNMKTSCLSSVEGIELLELDGSHSHGDEHEHSTETYDPHLWLYPLAIAKMAQSIVNTLVELYPNYKDEFNNNANLLIKKLNDLDDEYCIALANTNIKDKIILVEHDAYAYWTFYYGIERIKMRADNDSTESSASILQENINYAKSKNIKYIAATKNIIESDILNVYKTALDAEVVYLHSLETITNTEYNNGEDYFSIMKENLRTLLKIFPKKEEN